MTNNGGVLREGLCLKVGASRLVMLTMIEAFIGLFHHPGFFGLFFLRHFFYNKFLGVQIKQMLL